jgi:hypothetical protein
VTRLKEQIQQQKDTPLTDCRRSKRRLSTTSEAHTDKQPPTALDAKTETKATQDPASSEPKKMKAKEEHVG